jgi:hypothetical protein
MADRALHRRAGADRRDQSLSAMTRPPTRAAYTSVQSNHLTDLQGSHLNTVAPLKVAPTGGMDATKRITTAHFSQSGETYAA